MPNQQDLWAKVNAIKRRVLIAIGTTANLGHAFRSSQPYQAYTGLCGEAQMAHEDGGLTEELVHLLEEQAKKVIRLWRNYQDE
jgi:hypothetical protein